MESQKAKTGEVPAWDTDSPLLSLPEHGGPDRPSGGTGLGTVIPGTLPA